MRVARQLLATIVALAVILGAPPADAPRAAAEEPSATTVPTVTRVRLHRGVESLRVEWRQVPGTRVRYVVHRSIDGGRWQRVTSTRQTGLQVDGLPPARVSIRVRAVVDGVRGPWSVPVAMTPADPAWLDHRFGTEPVGTELPTGQQCASRVRPTPESRVANTRRNRNRGSSPHDVFPDVDGDFTGTTDEIMQWVACKWGINEDIVRAQAMVESSWTQGARGDYVSEQKWCHRSFRDQDPCPMSVGVYQIAYRWHFSAYERRNAIRSTAYNADYAYQSWRECFEGEYGWLNNVEPRGREYTAGHAMGCVGVWNAGRWFDDAAKAYIRRVRIARRDETWKLLGSGADHGSAGTPASDAVLNERPAL